jgi:reductive dehalogenase
VNYLIQIIDVIYVTVGIILGLTGLLYAISSIREKKQRAFYTAIAFTATILIVWFGYYYFFDFSVILLSIPPAFAILAAVLFFAPDGKISAIEINDSDERVDERDIMFAREEYKPGESKYKEYYAAKPQYKEIDDKIRDLPRLLRPGGKYYDPIRSRYIDLIFESVENLTDEVDGEISADREEVEAVEITKSIKKSVLEMGVGDVGIAPLNQNYIYSHIGRGPEKWGSEIVNNHKYAIVFTLEMDYDHVEEAPKLSITEESAMRYLQGAHISVEIARYIRGLGYPARAHIAGSNYQIMLPPVAYDAGLGELGRLGYIISPRLGPRVRLGAVTTDLPLIADKPTNFGVQDFCRKCLKCAVNCPSGAIPYGDKTEERGVKKWRLNIEKCIRYWRILGTDCGLCMKVCPYSHPPTFFHNIVRKAIPRSETARWLSINGDDIFYGRKTKVNIP